jgi:F-type H+-transporting ATPase subunit k
MATLGTTFVGSWLALRGGSKPEKEQGPPINAKSKEEENFVKYGISPLVQGPWFSAEEANECAGTL